MTYGIKGDEAYILLDKTERDSFEKGCLFHHRLESKDKIIDFSLKSEVTYKARPEDFKVGELYTEIALDTLYENTCPYQYSERKFIDGKRPGEKVIIFTGLNTITFVLYDTTKAPFLYKCVFNSYSNGNSLQKKRSVV